MEKHGWHFPDNFFTVVFWNANCCIIFFIKIGPKGAIYQASIGSGNGLALNRWQAIIWTNDNQVCDTI